MIWILKRATIGTAIACILSYLGIAFVTWDAYWVVELPTWTNFSRGTFLLVMVANSFLVFWVVWGVQLINGDYDK